MPDDRHQVICWDSCVFLSYVNEQPDRLPAIEHLLTKAERREITLLASVLARLEVAFAASEQAQGALDPQAEARIGELWRPGSPITLVELYPLIVDRATELMRYAITQGWHLKALDAAHLATAVEMGVTEFHTYDDQLFKYAPVAGCLVCIPPEAPAKLFEGGEWDRARQPEDPA
jgi:predicted nucleic acid-binding protein